MMEFLLFVRSNKLASLLVCLEVFQALCPAVPSSPLSHKHASGETPPVWDHSGFLGWVSLLANRLVNRTLS
jgi:hypothetical protein